MGQDLDTNIALLIAWARAHAAAPLTATEIDEFQQLTMKAWLMLDAFDEPRGRLRWALADAVGQQSDPAVRAIIAIAIDVAAHVPKDEK